MKDKKTVFFSAFRHIHPSDYEKWMEAMAAQGWHYDRFRQWSSIIMRFRKGDIKKYRFVYDPQTSPRKEYISTYEDFGWEYLGRMASAHMWRMPYETKRPEAFSDLESLAGRTRRNIAAVSVSFFIFLTALIAVAVILCFASGSLSPSDRLQVIIAEVFFGLITIILGGIMILLRRNLLR